MASNEKLSTKEYWDDVLREANLPLKVHKKQYSPWLINSFIKDSVLSGRYKSLMEIGSGSSAWLPFLAEEYNLLVSGLDYSEIGCKICEENLKIQGIRFEEIICKDVFKWDSGKKYDIIISFGVIEHFENPEDILKIIHDHLSDDGLIVTIVPNLLGISGKLTKLFLPDVYQIHKIISKESLYKLHSESGFECLKNDYTGFFYPMIIPWSVKTNGIFFKKGSLLRKVVMKILELKNALSTKILRGLKISVSSEYFSPFVIYTGKLKNSEKSFPCK
jgi:2-polyprenyl-3-methyl-5-hydroxy-6-metoxy-1,4-benzoquinol methylase